MKNILLVGNYPPDRQESMLRFAAMLHKGLPQFGFDVQLVQARELLNRLSLWPASAKKWLGYVDKLVLHLPQLQSRLSSADLVHICDQGNAPYVWLLKDKPHLVTCHDLLAVRSALGEDTACAVSAAGRLLQASILGSLKKARYIACDSQQTKSDVERLTGITDVNRIRLIPIGLNYPYRTLPAQQARDRLRQVPAIDTRQPFLLHVGSNEPRKNRATLLRIFQQVSAVVPQLVIAGQPLAALPANPEPGKIIQINQPSDELLEALYNSAHALVFPSYAEGFGWPIIEAQASGCPVICSDRQPLPEVAGCAALYANPEDVACFANHIVSLTKAENREKLIAAGKENVRRFETQGMLANYAQFYRDILDVQMK